MLKLNIVTNNGISDIIDLARVIWNQHYPGLISQEQIDYMLEEMYSYDSLLDQIKHNHQFFLINENNLNLGFLSVRKLEGLDSAFFLNKFYINQDIFGKGLGTRVFKMLIEMLNPSHLKLTVNRQNFKSINFYFKNGFKIESVQDFNIGNGYFMNDFVMVWNK